MASIYKRKNGKNWTIKIKDDKGKYVYFQGYTDKGLTKTYAAQLEYEFDQKRRGSFDPTIEARQTALADHLRAFVRFLESKGDTIEHIDRTEARIQWLLDKCKLVLVSDLLTINATDAVILALRNMRAASKGKKSKAAPKPVKPRTKNYYLTAFQGFCRWGIAHRNFPQTPVLEIPRQRETEAKERRALTEPEIVKLFKAEGETHGLTGDQRRMVYRLALATGLRAHELACLTGEAFDLGDGFVLVTEGTAKNRKEARQPLPSELVADLRAFLAPGVLFPGNWYQRAAEMVRFDGVDSDFHSLRTTFVTTLVRGGVHPRVVQALARHSQIGLTMKQYTKLEFSDYSAAVENVARVQQTPAQNCHSVTTPDLSPLENPEDFNSPGRIRTCDQGIMSPLL